MAPHHHHLASLLLAVLLSAIPGAAADDPGEPDDDATLQSGLDLAENLCGPPLFIAHCPPVSEDQPFFYPDCLCI